MSEHSYVLTPGIGLSALLLLAGSMVLLSKRKTLSSFLQLVGAACLVVVVFAHIAEALRLLPWMGWGLEQSIGHYVDLGSAALGLALFPVGYLSDALTRRRDEPLPRGF